MATKRILLSIPPTLFKQLQQEQKKFAYASVQELIVETLRDAYLRKPAEKATRGRPKKLREMDILRRKRIFE